MEHTDWPEGTTYTFEPGDGSMEVILPAGTKHVPASLRRDRAVVVLRRELKGGFTIMKILGEQLP